MFMIYCEESHCIILSLKHLAIVSQGKVIVPSPVVSFQVVEFTYTVLFAVYTVAISETVTSVESLQELSVPVTRLPIKLSFALCARETHSSWIVCHTDCCQLFTQAELSLSQSQIVAGSLSLPTVAYRHACHTG
jgi:hypothetical protein